MRLRGWLEGRLAWLRRWLARRVAWPITTLAAVWRAAINRISRTSLRARLAVSYALLITATILAFVLTQAFPQVGFFHRYGANIAADFLGILIGVLFVDRLLAWRHERQLAPVRTVALRRLESHLRYLVVWFHNAFVGAMAPNSPVPTSTEDLLDRWPEVVQWLDFCAEAPTNQRWAHWLAAGVSYWTGGIRSVLDRHDETLGVELVAALEEVLDADLLMTLQGWRMVEGQLCASGEYLGFQALWVGPDRDPRREFAERAKKLFAAYEKAAGRGPGIRREFFEEASREPWAGHARSSRAPVR